MMPVNFVINLCTLLNYLLFKCSYDIQQYHLHHFINVFTSRYLYLAKEIIRKEKKIEIRWTNIVLLLLHMTHEEHSLDWATTQKIYSKCSRSPRPVKLLHLNLDINFDYKIFWDSKSIFFSGFLIISSILRYWLKKCTTIREISVRSET